MGSLIVGCVWQATLARASMPINKRRFAWLYVDEFQDVVRLPPTYPTYSNKPEDSNSD